MNEIILNEKEKAVYEYLLSCTSSPTVREIAAAAKIKSTSTVHKILAHLNELGLITKSEHSSRGIKVVGREASVQVPLLGKVTAGMPILAVEQIEEYIPIPQSFGSREELFALRVSGLSMKNVGILDGDIVIANKELTSENGDIVIALIEDEATVKTLRFSGSKPYLQPENPDFSPIYPDNLTILGKVVGSFRKY